MQVSTAAAAASAAAVAAAAEALHAAKAALVRVRQVVVAVVVHGCGKRACAAATAAELLHVAKTAEVPARVVAIVRMHGCGGHDGGVGEGGRVMVRCSRGRDEEGLGWACVEGEQGRECHRRCCCCCW